MELSIILTTTLLSTSPDLCADVYLDPDGEPYRDAIGQTFSRFCEWDGPDAPVLDRDVCCTIRGDTARCALPDRKGRCSTDARLYYCAYGETSPKGTVVCYQPLANVCDYGFCTDVRPPDAGPQEDGVCCWPNGTCTNAVVGQDAIDCWDGGGILGNCRLGATNADGTVDCFDE
ncbi:MAG: hypothetical protein R6X02_30920 [Enhygromyxa sp.]